MADQKSAYLRSKAEDCLSKDNYTGAIDYYTQLYEYIATVAKEQRAELPALCDKVVKLLNAVAMRYIQKGKLADSIGVS